LCPSTSWKRTSKEYGKGVPKDDIVTSFLVHLIEFEPSYWSHNWKGSHRSFFYIKVGFANHFYKEVINTSHKIVLKLIYIDINSKNHSLISKVWLLLTNIEIVPPNNQGLWIKRFYIQQIDSLVYWQLCFLIHLC